MSVEVDYDKWAEGQIEESCGFLIGKKYAMGPRDSRRNILSWMVFSSTAGRTADTDKDDEKQDDPVMSQGLETRMLLSADSPCPSV